MRARLNNGDGLRMRSNVNKKLRASILGHSKGHVHSLGGGGRFIQQTCARNFQTREFRDNGLKIQQAFKTPL